MQDTSIPKDPLESLLIDADEVDRTRIANSLKDLVAIDSKSGAVVFRSGSRRLTANQKVIAYLLGRKVSSLLGKSDVEAVQAKTVIDETGLAAGTVHSALKRLRDSRLVAQESDGAYLVAAYQIHDALDLVRAKDEGE